MESVRIESDRTALRRSLKNRNSRKTRQTLPFLFAFCLFHFLPCDPYRRFRRYHRYHHYHHYHHFRRYHSSSSPSNSISISISIRFPASDDSPPFCDSFLRFRLRSSHPYDPASPGNRSKAADRSAFSGSAARPARSLDSTSAIARSVPCDSRTSPPSIRSPSPRNWPARSQRAACIGGCCTARSGTSPGSTDGTALRSFSPSSVPAIRRVCAQCRTASRARLAKMGSRRVARGTRWDRSRPAD